MDQKKTDLALKLARLEFNSKFYKDIRTGAFSVGRSAAFYVRDFYEKWLTRLNEGFVVDETDLKKVVRNFIRREKRNANQSI